jgi:hypothetical protein
MGGGCVKGLIEVHVLAGLVVILGHRFLYGYLEFSLFNITELFDSVSAEWVRSDT